MMKRWIVVCAILVLAQVGLTLWTNLAHQRGVSERAKGPLLAMQGATVTGLLLEDGAGRSLALNKVKDGWILPGSADFPADAVRIQSLIGKLTALQRGWPEATTAEAATRFKVAADRFEHKLTLLQQEKPLAVVYFGISPGLRKLYFRVDNDPEIHVLEVPPHDLDTSTDAWIDTSVLHLKPEQVLRVSLPGLELEQTKQGLQPAGLKEGEELIKDRRDSLVKRLTRLSISHILGKEVKPEYGLDKPALRYSIALEGGTTIDYLFGQPPKPASKEGELPVGDNSYVLKVSNQEQLLRVDGWQVDELKKASRASLVKPKAEATPVPQQSEASQPGKPSPLAPLGTQPPGDALTPAPGQ
jgi:hypothetical protein